MWRSLALAGTLALGACADEIAVRGNMPDPEDIDAIKVGDNRRDVAERLGSPSTLSTFQDGKWYYIGQKTQQFAFMKPEVVERQIFVVSFDDKGIVQDTTLYALEDGQIIDPVSRTTPTEGQELTILQQLFGNIGRFNPEGAN